MNPDPLEGHPDSVEVRHVLDVVTRRPGCESRCDLVTRLIVDLGKALGASEAVVRVRYGLGDPEAASEAQGWLGRAESGHSCPHRPLPRETTATGSGS